MLTSSLKVSASQKVGLPPLISAASRCPSTVTFRHVSDEMPERLNAAIAAFTSFCRTHVFLNFETAKNIIIYF